MVGWSCCALHTLVGLIVSWFVISFEDSELRAMRLVAIIGPTAFILATASYVRGVQVSWRRSRIRALAIVGVSLVLFVLPTAGAVFFFRDNQGKIRLSADKKTLAALQAHVEAYHRQHGRYPETRQRWKACCGLGGSNGSAPNGTGPTTRRGDGPISPSPTIGRAGNRMP
jgi:hypothetical protein